MPNDMYGDKSCRKPPTFIKSFVQNRAAIRHDATYSARFCIALHSRLQCFVSLFVVDITFNITTVQYCCAKPFVNVEFLFVCDSLNVIAATI